METREIAMQRKWLVLGAAVLAAAAFGFASWRGSAKEHVPVSVEGAPITWRTDLAAARAEAREKDRALMILFRCEP